MTNQKHKDDDESELRRLRRLRRKTRIQIRKKTRNDDDESEVRHEDSYDELEERHEFKSKGRKEDDDD